ncbi:hypothetical protein E5676_scaffold2119G00580 [Cucumis melo var. makuwa]|uniref:Uncharacterized protein n=1 Tax=Cucumis melo var. makuwa TaxID=1194695 RepID=A0A5D3C177_CUCMM|nr:hypothetical protein E5676_scaffold2119G00580 [Cucumis melo var. makuwa]
MRDFLWEVMDEGRGSHLVSWQVVGRPINQGRLAQDTSRLSNTVLLAKWLWRLAHELESLWQRIIMSNTACEK